MNLIKNIALCAVPAALVAAPYFIGGSAQQQIEQDVAELNSVPGYSARISDYDKGFFSSTAVVSLGMQLPGAEDYLADLIKLELDIKHGPLFLGKRTGLGLLSVEGRLANKESETLAEFKQKAGIDELVTLDGVIGFSGGFELNLAVPEFSIEEKGRFNFSGISSSINGSGEQIDFDFSAPGLEFIKEDEQIRVQGISSSGEFTIIGKHLYIGESTMTVDEMSVQTEKAGKQSIMLKSLTAVSDTTLSDDKNTMAVGASVKLDQISGDAFDLSDTHFAMNVSNLPVTFIENYMAAMEDMYQADNPEAAGSELALKLMGQLPELLKASPVIEITDLDFKLDGQSFESDAVIRYDGNHPVNFANQMEMLAGVEVTANASADEALATLLATKTTEQQLKKANTDPSVSSEQIAQYAQMQSALTLQALVDQGMLQKNDTGYRFQFVLEQGQALLNGKHIPLPIPAAQ